MTISQRQLEERKMRQERILTGALEVFKSKGFDGATMDEIAQKSDFGKATLYYYFHSKEEVFAAILEDGWQKLWASLELVIAGNDSPRQTFINVLLKIAENARNRPGLYEFLFNAPKVITFEEQPWKRYQERMYGTIQGLLEDGVKSGEFPNINSQLLFKAMGGLFMGLVLMGDRKKQVSEKDIEELLNQLIMNPQEQL
ncbi:MAG: TetR/AcrR family transcriptional regulator [Candidatus Marinimicrobia bacterium]|nr:TetR/AcrR family transcriptional regulator [Candidatus Neomarinimicrobiota bacterium]